MQLMLGSEKANAKRKNIIDLGSVTAAEMIASADINIDGPILICGRYNKTFPVFHRLVSMSKIPFVLIGTKKDFDNSCLKREKTEWETNVPSRNLQQGNGLLILKPSSDTYLTLKEYMADWNTHLVVICFGGGLQTDGELFNLLNGLGNYVILSEALGRSIKKNDGWGINEKDILAAMKYIVVSFIGTSASALLEVLPSYMQEKFIENIGYNESEGSSGRIFMRYYHGGSGFHFGKQRAFETGKILSDDDLVNLQDENKMVVYNTDNRHVWVMRIVC